MRSTGGRPSSCARQRGAKLKTLCSSMPRAGKVRLLVTREGAINAANWLSAFFDPQTEWAARLESIFRKAARRRGRARLRFTLLLDRDDAREFGKRRDVAVVTRSASVATIQMMESCQGRRGRRPLSRAQRAQRASRAVAVEERHRLRLAREARREHALDEWHREHGSILGAVGTDALDSYPGKVT